MRLDYQCYNCKNCSTPISSRKTTPFSELKCSATIGQGVRPAATVGECIDYEPWSPTLSENEFIEKYCHNCGTQRCEGIGTPWFDGCERRFEM